MLRVLIMVYIITHYCIASVTFCAVKRFHSERRNWQVLVTMEEYLPLHYVEPPSKKFTSAIWLIQVLKEPLGSV